MNSEHEEAIRRFKTEFAGCSFSQSSSSVCSSNENGELICKRNTRIVRHCPGRPREELVLEEDGPQMLPGGSDNYSSPGMFGGNSDDRRSKRLLPEDIEKLPSLFSDSMDLFEKFMGSFGSQCKFNLFNHSYFCILNLS